MTRAGAGTGDAGGPVLLATAVAMLAFAGNSLLCRQALRGGAIDPASFTAVRLLCGAVTLAAIAALRRRPSGAAMRQRAGLGGSWASAGALFVYAAAFSWAYLQLSAGTGALLLFGAVQLTMVGVGLWRGERLRARQWVGLAAAIGGLVAMLATGLTAPPALGAAAMIAAGIAWGIYTLRGRGRGDPLHETAGNFVRAVPLALAGLLLAGAGGALAAVRLPGWVLAPPSAAGLAWAALSGAVTSGMGYALWYRVVPSLSAAAAASVQLTVPVIAAVLGAWLLGEGLSTRLIASTAVVVAGVAAVIRGGRRGLER